MNLGELQAAVNKAFAEGASKTDTVYLDVSDEDVIAHAEAMEVEQRIMDRKFRSIVIKGY